jgi:hypothetical protein
MNDEARAHGFLVAAVGASTASIGLGLIYWASRIGFDNPATTVINATGLSLAIINLPVVTWKALRLRASSESWTRSYSLLWILALAAVAALGRITQGSAIDLTWTFTAIGAVSLVIVLSMWARGATLIESALLLIGSTAYSAWAGGVVWGRIYKSPVFTEMLIGQGVVHHDGIALAALSNMLRTYHVPSPGLDGIPYLAYHWGSQWLFAQLANLSGESVLQFYQLGFVTTWIPIFFASVVVFAVQTSPAGKIAIRSFSFWAVFLAATVGVLPITGMDALGVWTSNLMISESYTVVIPSALMVLATVIAYWRERGSDVLAGNFRGLDYVFVGVLLPVATVALGYIKISLMVLATVAIIYAGLRLKAWRRWQLVVAGALIVIAVGVAYPRVALAAHEEGIAPLDFLKGFVPMVWWPFFFLVHLFWSLLYVVLRLRREGARTVDDLLALMRAGKILDVEIVALIAIVAVSPGLLIHIDGGSAFYFSDVQRWLSVALLLASATALLPAIGEIRLSRLKVLAIAFVAFPLVVSMARNSVYWTTRMLKANAELRHALYPPDVAASIPPGMRSLPYLTNAAMLEAGLERSVNYTPVEGLLALATMPLSEKRHTAVFVPQSETRYWTILKRPGACSFSGFLVPAISGMTMIDGMPAADCTLSRYYGLGLYEKRSAQETDAAATPEALCARARKFRLGAVISLHFGDDGRMTQSLAKC